MGALSLRAGSMPNGVHALEAAPGRRAMGDDRSCVPAKATVRGNRGYAAKRGTRERLDLLCRAYGLTRRERGSPVPYSPAGHALRSPSASSSRVHCSRSPESVFGKTGVTPAGVARTFGVSRRHPRPLDNTTFSAAGVADVVMTPCGIYVLWSEPLELRLSGTRESRVDFAQRSCRTALRAAAEPGRSRRRDARDHARHSARRAQCASLRAAGSCCIETVAGSDVREADEDGRAHVPARRGPLCLLRAGPRRRAWHGACARRRPHAARTDRV